MSTRALFEREWHDLSQPLTTLQCRLELAQILGDEQSMREAVCEGLEDCTRVFAAIRAMRLKILRTLEEAEARG